MNEASLKRAPGEFAASADEAALVEAVLRRDRKATEEFISRYSDAIYSYLHRRMFPNTDLVEDCFQQVFLAAWQALHSYRGENGLQSWLLGIARHKVQDVYRERLRLMQWDEGEDPVDSINELPDEIASRTELHHKVWDTLHKLPEHYRMLLIWRYWERQSGEDMARQIGKTAKSVERSLARAREQFRRMWLNEVQNA
jgi:RNA polymerase sigma-70 factor, ECF subfamily